VSLAAHAVISPSNGAVQATFNLHTPHDMLFDDMLPPKPYLSCPWLWPSLVASHTTLLTLVFFDVVNVCTTLIILQAAIRMLALPAAHLSILELSHSMLFLHNLQAAHRTQLKHRHAASLKLHALAVVLAVSSCTHTILLTVD
jgi:hypothetical protein